jgi:hypothetical protein
VNVARVDRESLRATAHRHYRPGISAHQAIVLAYSELTGRPLAPDTFDDSAVLLRAERLLIDGLSVSEAIDTARAEFATWSVHR